MPSSSISPRPIQLLVLAGQLERPTTELRMQRTRAQYHREHQHGQHAARSDAELANSIGSGAQRSASR